MTIKYNYNNETNTVNIKVTDELKSSEIIEYFTNLIDSNVIKEGFIEVVDLNEATDFILRYSDLEVIRELTAKLNKIGQKCSLMCAYNELSKGISSMMLPLYQKADFVYYLCDSEVALKSKLRVFHKN